jgi:CTP-dependent riboflavin kinase
LRKPEQFQETVTIPVPLHAIQMKSVTEDAVRRDLRTLKEASSGQFLAHRWSASTATVSRWLEALQEDAAIHRQRSGKLKQIRLTDMPMVNPALMRRAYR